jgi:hypothetical protein
MVTIQMPESMGSQHLVTFALDYPALTQDAAESVNPTN